MQSQPVYNYLTWVKQSFGNSAYNSLASNLEFTRTLKLNDWQLYGSSRLGVYNADTTLTNITFTINGIDSNGNFEVNQVISQTSVSVNHYDMQHELAYKQFELTNHLGNVLATVLDRKTNNKADVVTAQHYYPFGSVMSSYKAEEFGYRFGFNGKVDDKETGTQDYGFRIYNSSLGKFLSVDRMSRDFSWWSPYHFAGNSPICAIDLEGLELKVVTHTYKLDGDCKPYLVSTHVGITQNVTIILNGEAHAATDVYVVINGQILYSYTLYEPLNANECFPSARYDYSINENSQKEKEDDEYLNSGPWYSYPFRLAKILARDLLVPDNAPTVNDLSIVQTAAFPFLLPGKILQPEYSVGRYHDGSGHVKGKQIGNKGPALYDGQLRLDNSILFKRDARFSEK